MPDPQVAFDKLAQFERVEELALFLMKEGVRGIRSDSMACPIARWMELQSDEDSVWRVAMFGIDGYVGETDHHFYPTETMTTFIADFDHGRWRGLRVEEPDE